MNDNIIIKSLKYMITYQASDLHIHANMPPVYRIDGILTRYDSEIISEAEIKAALDYMLNQSEIDKLFEKGEVDFSFHINSFARYRGSAFLQRGHIGLTLRLIPLKIPTLEQLRLPDVIKDFTELETGLVIVTGATGSGKSSTLAALLNLINMQKAKHIITLEDPIEFIHVSNNSLITQREVGKDTISFASGLRAALRKDPDVILIGEMRDLETTEIAIRAAETGHLVFTTMHTPGAAETVERILGSFPPHQRSIICSQLSFCLKGVIFQKLLPRINGGRIPAVEVMTATTAVRNLIRENKVHQLKSIIQTSMQYGMISMKNALSELHDNQLISNKVLQKNSEQY